MFNAIPTLTEINSDNLELDATKLEEMNNLAKNAGFLDYRDFIVNYLINTETICEVKNLHKLYIEKLLSNLSFKDISKTIIAAINKNHTFTSFTIKEEDIPNIIDLNDLENALETLENFAKYFSISQNFGDLAESNPKIIKKMERAFLNLTVIL